jgi:hypothetical protein
MSFCMVPGGCDRLHHRQRRQTCRETPAAQSGKSRVHNPGGLGLPGVMGHQTPDSQLLHRRQMQAVQRPAMCRGCLVLFQRGFFHTHEQNVNSAQNRLFSAKASNKNLGNDPELAIFDCIGNAMWLIRPRKGQFL